MLRLPAFRAINSENDYLSESEMKRLFIAVDLAIAVVERLAMAQAELQESVSQDSGDQVDLRLVAPENIHITLKFLGDQPLELMPMVEKALEKLTEPLFPFEVECARLGAFPRAARPRIIWAGLDEESEEVLGLLQKALERDLEQLGVERESRPFHPHVTLGRVKSRRVAPDFEEILKPYGNVSFGKSFIKDLVLFESHLEARGPRYEVVRRFSLGRS